MKTHPNHSPLVKLYALIALMGLFVAIYMSYSKIVGAPVICGLSSCEEVSNSPYAYILNIPIAFYGLTFYALAFVSSGLYKNIKLMFFLALVGVCFTGYFTFIEAFVIKAWCQWCLVSAWLSFVLLIISYRLRFQPKSSLS